MRKIIAKIYSLEYMPKMYPKIKLNKFDKKEYRKIVVESFIIIYTVEAQNVYIHNIFHEKNNYFNK